MSVHIIPIGLLREETVSNDSLSNLLNSGFPHIDEIHVIKSPRRIYSSNSIGGIPVHIHNLEDQFNILSIVEVISEIHQSLTKGEEVYIDVTGGTKLMSIGAYLAGTYLGCRMYYKSREMSSYIDVSPPKVNISELSNLQIEILKLLRQRNRESSFQSGPKSLSQRELAFKLDTEKLSVSPQTISYSCKKLRKLGLIEPVSTDDDLRTNSWKITQNGIIATLQY